MSSHIPQIEHLEQLAEMLVHVGRSARAEGREDLLTAAQWTALRFFARANRASRTPSAFASFQATTRGTASQVIKSLVRGGYLERHASETDRRSARFEVTARGRDILEREPELDFLYYSNDMIGAGGLLYLLEQGRDIPADIGLAGFNGVELLQGLPRKLATMDACRDQIGRKAAEIIAARVEDADASFDKIIEMTPKITYGDTLRR